MPKKLSDQDRILNFAFSADVPALQSAIAVLRAALAAKTSKAPVSRVSKAKAAPKVQPSDSQTG